MPNEPTPLAQNTTDELDEILVKEPDGTFRVVKVAPITKQGVVTGPVRNDIFNGAGQAPITNPPAPIRVPGTLIESLGTGGVVTGQTPSKPTVPALPRVEKPAPSTMVLGNEEEKELATVREKTKTIAPQMDDKSAEIARRAIAESGVALSDPSLANRLLMVLVASVKEVRKELETRDLLMRPKEQGGLGMTMNEAMRLLSLLKTPITNPPSSGVVTGQAKPIVPLPVVSKPTLPPSVQLPSASKPVAPPLPAPKPVVSPPPPLAQKQVTPPQPKLADGGSRLPAGRQVVTGQAPPTPKPVSLPPQQVMRPPAPTKPVVQDVSFTPKLVGPIDELQMHLSEWRRMAPTLKDRGTKIEEKMRLLEEESYADRLKGVAAWYASDVVRLYQDVGRESLSGGKPVVAVLAEREAKGLPTLTLEEFQSVAELNERLRF